MQVEDEEIADYEEIKLENEYVGPSLPLNTLCLHQNVERVKHVALGQQHLLAHCVNKETNKDGIYVMGDN